MRSGTSSTHDHQGRFLAANAVAWGSGESCRTHLSATLGREEKAVQLAADLVSYSRLRDKVRLREDESEYEEAERLIARLDALLGATS